MNTITNGSYDETKKIVPSPLCVDEINNAIDIACSKATSDTILSNKSYSTNWKRRHKTHQSSNLLYGIIGEINNATSTTLLASDSTQLSVTTTTNMNTTTNTNTNTNNPIIEVTFYFAYSTWDGRILYIDQIENSIDDDNLNKNSRNDTEMMIFIYRLLANIASTLHCRRLTWQHTIEQTIVFPTTIQSPQTMNGWLTLYWETDAIRNFLLQNNNNNNGVTTSCNQNTSIDPSTFLTTIIKYLQQSHIITTPSSQNTSRRLRLATDNDVDIIYRLVQGLAEFEKEPDAVYVTSNHYHVDGFQSNPPLFYCILLEVLVNSDMVNSNNGNMNDDIGNSCNTSQNWYACGMAFFWIGSKQQQSNNMNSADVIRHPLIQQETTFLYLEDLFIEDAYRGNGSGTYIMSSLGEIALQLNCYRMVWQALDWNTPALTFYQNKIGAYIVDGLLTTRYAGSTIQEFYESSNPA